jgi:16S rRNA (guanine966-N2)-methyltransferase
LDLFSGSGSLSFESLSRYAKFVTLVELNVQSAKLIRENLDLLKISNAELVVGDALKFVQRVNQDEPYNIVFLDPPFRKGFLSQICSLLNKNAFLCNNALIYVEQEIENTAEMPSNWTLLKSKTAGQVSYSLYRNN